MTIFQVQDDVPGELPLLISHHFEFADVIDAYETFGNAAHTHALKVIINVASFGFCDRIHIPVRFCRPPECG